MRARDFDREKFLTETWPAALESGEFKQQTDGELQNKAGYCCLGVACELLSRERLIPRTQWRGLVALPRRARELLSLSPYGDYFASKQEKEKKNGGRSYRNLAGDNDSGFSFKRIAATIRRKAKAGLFATPSTEA